MSRARRRASFSYSTAISVGGAVIGAAAATAAAWARINLATAGCAAAAPGSGGGGPRGGGGAPGAALEIGGDLVDGSGGRGFGSAAAAPAAVPDGAVAAPALSSGANARGGPIGSGIALVGSAEHSYRAQVLATLEHTASQ